MIARAMQMSVDGPLQRSRVDPSLARQTAVQDAVRTIVTGHFGDLAASGEKVQAALRAALAQKALALDPATTSAYRLLAIINMHRRRYDLALGQIDRAMEINPSDAENYVSRGNILSWAGRAAEALPWL